MASSVVKKRSDGKRPFRLLNLDKSLQAQKAMCDCPLPESRTKLTPSCSAATNAAISPLLLLPPEIRCRIYDYAFADHFVHISFDSVRFNQILRQQLCQDPQECAAVQSQHCGQKILHHAIDPSSSRLATQSTHCVQTGSRKIPVQLLQVSRQIYHEAVLKPFTHSTFHFVSTTRGSRSLNMFLEKLVPEQLRAITCLCGTIHDLQFLSQPLISRFKGLKHIDMNIVVSSQYPTLWLPEYLRGFAAQSGVVALNECGLKSLRFTVSLLDADPADSVKTTILEWIRLQKIKILAKPLPILTAD